MLWVYAYRFDPPERNSTFKATAFSYELTQDGRNGSVTLIPGARCLTVGGSAEDYQCVRIFGHDGLVFATMGCLASGEVLWYQPRSQG